MTLLDYTAIAALLQVSRTTARDLMAAAQVRREVRDGRRPLDTVPPRLRRYLDLGFPAPVVIGPRLKRVSREAVELWIRRQQ